MRNVEQVKGELAVLIADIQEIDVQLGTRKNNAQLNPETRVEYYRWRHGALFAKQKKQAQMRTLKTELAQLGQLLRRADNAICAGHHSASPTGDALIKGVKLLFKLGEAVGWSHIPSELSREINLHQERVRQVLVSEGFVGEMSQ